eukprot:SAG31_NODE_8230_length_1493_cov_1.398135_1_plen_233_part_00
MRFWQSSKNFPPAVTLLCKTCPCCSLYQFSHWIFVHGLLSKRSVLVSPFIFIGSIFLVALYMLLWMPCVFGLCDNPPSICDTTSEIGTAGTLFLVLYCLYYFAIDAYFVPHEALGAGDLTSNPKERTSIFGLVMFLSVFGILLGATIPGLIVTDDNQKTAFLLPAAVFATFFFLGTVSVSVTISERDVDEEQTPFVPSMGNCLVRTHCFVWKYVHNEFLYVCTRSGAQFSEF